MVGAIETLVRAKLMSGEPETAPEMLPGLLHFVVMQFFGEDAAWEEMTAAPLATWSFAAGSGDADALKFGGLVRGEVGAPLAR